MKTKSSCTLALLAAASVLLTSASSLSASETDDRIESSANNSYVFKTFLRNDSIKTDSKDGVVILTGTVAVASHKNLAQDIVENLPGVKSVDNQLVVEKPKLPEHSDTWMSLKINTVLLFHSNVSAAATNVAVDNKGVVTLTGTATSLAQKELTAEYVKDIDGVKSVVNNIKVEPVETESEPAVNEVIDDASIVAQIRVLLNEHRSTKTIKTKGKVVNGVVTITGIAKNNAEKSLVTKLISDVNGVKEVVNDMTIETASSKKL